MEVVNKNEKRNWKSQRRKRRSKMRRKKRDCFQMFNKIQKFKIPYEAMERVPYWLHNFSVMKLDVKEVRAKEKCTL